MNNVTKNATFPFKSSKNVKREITSTSKCFASIDFLQEYYQVPLNESSRDFTTLIFTKGQFRLTRTGYRFKVSISGMKLQKGIVENPAQFRIFPE